MTNPIPFSPKAMTLGHVEECVEHLRHTFLQLDRVDIDPTAIVHYLRQAREQQLARYGEAR